MTFATDRNLEREAVVHERDLLRDALRRSMGEVPFGDVKADFERRVDAGELIAVDQRPGAPGRAFTTREMLAYEQDTLALMRAGQGHQPALANADTRHAIGHAYPHLNDGQLAAVRQVLSSTDQIQALEGVAGAGKTTALSAVRDAAERAGYTVEGFAPTSRAAQRLGEAGITSSTLQRHLSASDESRDGAKHLYVLDESSLASTKQMHEFLQRLNPDDRVLLVGDVRQHQAVDAGRPYQQLQEAGMATARLDDIVRQKDPALKSVVEQLARGEVHEAIAQLDTQGRVHEIKGRDERFDAIAHEYAKHPSGTLVVSPDNQSRRDLNDVIHRVMQGAGQVDLEEHRVRVLVTRQEITGADRQWAEQYEPGNLVRYTKGSQTYGLDAGEYARVEHVNAKENLLTVERASGETVTYDPRRLQGVTVFRESDRDFAIGDRVQLTAPDREQQLANRELGTIEQIDRTSRHGALNVRLDSGRTVTFAGEKPLHLDYGYAVTSHSSQGQTADRVLVHVETERASEQLVNQRLAYVAVSRGRYDAQLYTDDASRLALTLGRDVSHRSAIESVLAPDSATHTMQPSVAVGHAAKQTRADHSIGVQR